MSKTNVYTLIATALLGVLLFVINRFTERLPTTPIEVADIAELQSERTAVAGYAKSGIPENGLPRLNDVEDLIKLLDDIGVPGNEAIATSLDWRRQHGFLGPAPSLGLLPEEAPRSSYDALEDEQLDLLSIDGEIGATQTIAARSVTVDPFYAMDMYQRAAAQGSTFALLRIASLRDTFSNAKLDAYQSDPEYLRKLSELRRSKPETLSAEAFGYAFAAVRDGGLPVIDRDLLRWLRQLMANVPLNMDEVACRQSETIFVEVSSERRRLGVPPVDASVPPIFFTVPYAADQLPCADTMHAWQSNHDLSRCEIIAIENARGERLDLYVCA